MKKYDIDTGPYGNGYRTEEDEFGLFVYADDAEDEIARLTRERDIWKSENDRILLIRAQMEARIAELEEAILVRDRAIKVANDSVERVDLILASWHKVFPVDDPVIARRMVEDRAHAEQNAEIARLTRELKEAGGCQSAMVIERGRLENRVDALSYECESLTRERDEAVRVAVWAAKHESEVLPAKMGLPSMLSWNGRVGVKFPIEYRQLPLTDTTDSDIYRALREAMGASEGGGDGD